MFKYVSLQYSLAQTARWALLGERIVDPATGTLLSREDSIEYKLKENANIYNISFGPGNPDNNIIICPIGNTHPGYAECIADPLTYTHNDNAGGSEEFFKIYAQDDINLGFFNVNIHATAIAKTEKYNSGS